MYIAICCLIKSLFSENIIFLIVWLITKVSGNGMTLHNQFPLEGSPIETKNKIAEFVEEDETEEEELF